MQHKDLTGIEHYLALTSSWAPGDWWVDAVKHVDAEMAQDSGHDWGHLGRVFTNARRIWALEAPDDTSCWAIVATAALFHDVVNLPKDSPDRHLASTMAGEHAHEWVTARGLFDTQQADDLADAIRCHSFSSGFRAERLPAMILSDADRLDALGAVGMARTFGVSGTIGRAMFHPTDPLARNRTPDDLQWGLDHFFCKLLELPGLMYTETGRTIGEERAAYMRGFLDQLLSELS